MVLKCELPGTGNASANGNTFGRMYVVHRINFWCVLKCEYPWTRYTNGERVYPGGYIIVHLLSSVYLGASIPGTGIRTANGYVREDIQSCTGKPVCKCEYSWPRNTNGQRVYSEGYTTCYGKVRSQKNNKINFYFII